MKKFMTFAFLLMAMGVKAQMAFEYSVPNVETITVPRGMTRVTVPSSADLSSLITSVKVDGVAVSADQIHPNPTTTHLYYDRLEVFTYQGKAYSFVFESDEFFTAVFISDTHTGNKSGSSVADLTTIMNNICAMGKDGKAKVTFDAAPKYVPRTDIVFCLGDIDHDKGDDGSHGEHTNFLNATAEVAKAANIPYVFIAGNHDFSPDYFDNGDKGVTAGTSGGHNADTKTIEAIKNNNTYWNNKNVFDENISYFTTGSNYDFEPNHFTFKFKDVRFYCANNYWFQKPHSEPIDIVIYKKDATYFAPDPIINKLSTFVDQHTAEASVWMQHVPWVAGGDCARWWLDQNDAGKYITTTDNSAYGTNTSGIAYNDATQATTLKRNPLAAIMMKTAGKINGMVPHFSGHTHYFADEVFTSTDGNSKIHDYTVAHSANGGENAYVVLMKRGVGVVEVKRVKF